ncbi:MFS transporter [Porphyrobacter sp. HT-58-2]|uniref:NnrU family protein n=1 Tax=Porphyrobacter sp. HT-58-2 TaxID=2023229 RepID=UPI000CDC6736|nr:NnrU family protein [Porphyrobacter sp. HT-58-2]AUX68572.1 MFS transporter [Porphyrobacter sp. HT-58-2]
MDEGIWNLVAANVAFVGSHFAMSHPLRAPMVKALGEKGFSLAYTAVSFAALGWVYFAFLAAPGSDLPGSGEAGWIIATVLTWPAMVLLAGSFVGNPALPTPMAEQQTRAEPKGALRVTRHPMMWGIGLWAISHMALFWSTRTMITALAMGVLALVGARLQDAKKEALMGAAWAEWERKTSYWPRWGQLFRVGAVPLIAGTVLWLAGSWMHLWRADIPAGVFRWLG